MELGRTFREAWIEGVKNHFPGDPKPGYVTPWDETPQWEKEAATAVGQQIHDLLAQSKGAARHLDDESKGQFVSACWITQIHHRVESPKPSYVAPWSELPQWQRLTDIGIFHAVEQVTFPASS